MNKFQRRVYEIDEFTNKEYADILKTKTESELETHKSLSLLITVLYIVTVVLLSVPFFLNIPSWIQGIITFVTPIAYIAAFALQCVAAHKIMARILGAAFSSGLDMEKPPIDMIVGALYSILAIFVFITCPPIAVSNQIKKDKLIIKTADKVLSTPDQIV